MKRATILLADNHAAFLETRTRILEAAGYRVLTANSPETARTILEKSRLDTAILDIRLKDDIDEEDVSGLLLAQECARHLPKIMLTSFPSYEKALAALMAEPGSFPPAVRFLEKRSRNGSGEAAMLQAVEDALLIGRKGFGATVDEVTQGLNEDYEQARREARNQGWLAGLISLLGIIVIMAGVGVALLQPQSYPLGVITAAGGLLTEAVNYLFLQRVDKAHGRVDRFHQELHQIRLLRTLNSAADDLIYEENREQMHKEIVLQAGRAWFNSASLQPFPGGAPESEREG